MIWGMLADNVTGPGFLLAPFLLGTGMKRLTFMGTLTIITLEINSIKQFEFSLTDLLSAELVALSVIVGLCTTQENWVGKVLLQKLSYDHYWYIINVYSCGYC
jgi:hypothetical protein